MAMTKTTKHIRRTLHQIGLRHFRVRAIKNSAGEYVDWSIVMFERVHHLGNATIEFLLHSGIDVQEYIYQCSDDNEPRTFYRFQHATTYVDGVGSVARHTCLNIAAGEYIETILRTEPIWIWPL